MTHPTSSGPNGSWEQPPTPYHWLPFGGGINRCLGGRMAMFEARVLLRTILQEMTFVPETSTGENQKAQTVLLLPEKRATVTPAQAHRSGGQVMSGDERTAAWVTVDPELCLGSGTCMAIAPALFRDGRQAGTARPLRSVVEQSAKLDEAVSRCPTGAIEATPATPPA